MLNLAIAPLRKRPEGLPWKDRAHDHIMAQDSISAMYLGCGLNPPRYAWATSPKAMYLASRMLRHVQAGSAQAMIASLIPAKTRGFDSTESEAKRALLTAMLDPNITTQSGALMRATLEARYGKADRYPPAVDDLKLLLNFSDTYALGTSAPASFREQAMYPALYPEPSWWPVAAHAVTIMPFVKICFLSLPPTWTHTNSAGHLHCDDGPAMEWTDGFAVNVDLTQEYAKRVLANKKTLELPSGEDDGQDE